MFRGRFGETADRFRDRAEAGRVLAGSLGDYAARDDVLVLALPRGGVPVAFEVARALAAPLDVLIVRKLGVPGREELALGAIAGGGVQVVNRRLVEALGMPMDRVDSIAARERQELERQERDYRRGREPPDLAGRSVILVDDGLATGATMLAAITVVRLQGAAHVVVAVPVAPRETCDALRRKADVVAVPGCRPASAPWAPGTTTSRPRTTTRLDSARALVVDLTRSGYFKHREAKSTRPSFCGMNVRHPMRLEKSCAFPAMNSRGTIGVGPAEIPLSSRS